MFETEKRIPELVIIPSQIEGRKFGINVDNDLVKCYYCGSNLFYVVIRKGIVSEDHSYGILGNKSNRVCSVREIGFSLYCSKCGSFNEHYDKWFYPEDQLIYAFDDDLDESELAEIDWCLSQYDQKGDFEDRYKFGQLETIKKALIEYDLKYPIK